MMLSLFDSVLPFLQSFQTWLMLVLGLVIGSFLNVCILRIPDKTFFSHHRSVCPACGQPVPFWLNIPVFSYVMLRGRAACCQAPVSLQYPLVEAGTGLLLVLVYWHFPFILRREDGFALDPSDFIRFVHLALFSCVLVVISVIDLRLQIIPDVISLPMILLSAVWVALHPELDWQSSLIGVVAGGGGLYAVAWIYYMVRKDIGMGMGDVKLLAAIGGWLGYQALIPTVFLASVLGASVGIGAIIVSGRMTLKTRIPFGPFLAIGSMIHILWGDELAEWLITL